MKFLHYDNKSTPSNNKDMLLPWNISEINQIKIDAWVNCILVPLGHSKAFEAKSVFCYITMCKFNVKMSIIKSLFPLIFITVGKICLCSREHFL